MAFGSVPHPLSLASAFCFPFVVSFLLFYTIFCFPLAGVHGSGALWQSRVKVAHQPHKLTIVGSTPASATKGLTL